MSENLNGRFEDIVEEESRICVHHLETENEVKMNVDRQNISIVDTREVLRRIELFLRMLDIMNPNQIPKKGIDDVKFFPDEPTDDPRVCIVWNPATKQIRFSVIGMGLWEANIAVENAATYMNYIIMNPLGEYM